MVETQEETPYFEYERYQRECPNPNCEDELLFHYASLGNPPVSSATKLHIVSKCINPDCGFIDHYEPPVDDDTSHFLREEWNGASYHPWDAHYVDDPEEEIEAIFGEEVALEVQERLEDLGYF